MNSRECETCIKRKTMYCPNSSECLETEDKKHYQNRTMLLEENKQLRNALEKVRDSAGWREILELSGIIQERDKYKGVIEEVRERSKLERKTALSLNQHYAVSIIDSVLQILDKVKVDNE